MCWYLYGVNIHLCPSVCWNIKSFRTNYRIFMKFHIGNQGKKTEGQQIVLLCVNFLICFIYFTWGEFMVLILLCCWHIKFSSVIHGLSKLKLLFNVRVMAISSKFDLTGSAKVKRSVNLLFVDPNLLHWQPAFDNQPQAIYIFKLGSVYCNPSSGNTSITSLQVSNTYVCSVIALNEHRSLKIMMLWSSWNI